MLRIRSGPRFRDACTAGSVFIVWPLDPTPHPCSPFDADSSEISAVDLARLALRAEAESAALTDEHRDATGRIPDVVEARAIELSRLTDRLGGLARLKVAQHSRPQPSMPGGFPDPR